MTAVVVSVYHQLNFHAAITFFAFNRTINSFESLSQDSEHFGKNTRHRSSSVNGYNGSNVVLFKQGTLVDFGYILEEVILLQVFALVDFLNFSMPLFCDFDFFFQKDMLLESFCLSGLKNSRVNEVSLFAYELLLNI